MITSLTKQSTKSEIKCYFERVLSLSKSNEEFPVNLDDVWPLLYARKNVAVRALVNDDLFIESIDYQPLHQNVQRSGDGLFCGENKVTYLLSVPCLEFFIARKVRSVFEIYRKVFHKVANSECTPFQIGNIGMSLDDTLTPLAQYNNIIAQRWQSVKDKSKDNAAICNRSNLCDEYYCAYRNCINDLVYAETVARIEGIEAIQ